eukprot:886421_1
MLRQCLVVSNLLELNIVKSETQIHFLQLRIDSTIDNNLHPNQCNHPEENHASSPQSFQAHCFLANQHNLRHLWNTAPNVQTHIPTYDPNVSPTDDGRFAHTDC